MRTIMAGLAEFERDLIRERVKSGLAAAKARGVVLGRQLGQRPTDKKAKRVLAMHRDGLSYRLIGRNLGLSKKHRYGDRPAFGRLMRMRRIPSASTAASARASWAPRRPAGTDLWVFPGRGRAGRPGRNQTE
jgi:Resolvase, N terminal domain